ncbi:MAG: hypothetical protein ACFFD2_21095 [Promethearchaeota archaeon]
MSRKKISNFREYLEKKEKKKIDFRFNEKTPLPKYARPLTPRILRKEVLEQIEKKMDKISKEEELPWTGKSLRTAIQKDLVELNALSKLAPRVFALEPQAVSEFRSWITRVKPFYGFSNDFKARRKIRNIPKPQDPTCLENCINTIRMFTELTFAALMTARSEIEWLDIQHRIDTLFLRNVIITSFYRDLRNFRERGNKDSFINRMFYYARERNWGDDMTGICFDDLDLPGGRPPRDKEQELIRKFEEDIDELDYCFTEEYTLENDPKAEFYEATARFSIFCYSLLRSIAFTTIFEYRALLYHLPANSSYLISSIISSISPQHLCADEILTIKGQGFGMNQQVSNLRLLLPFEVPGYGKVWRIVDIEEEESDEEPIPPMGDTRWGDRWRQWTDTTIMLKCPDWARSGPVGFVDIQVFQDLNIFREWIGEVLWTSGEIWDYRDPRWGDLRSCGIQLRQEFVQTEVSVFPAPPLRSTNMFWGTIPEIYMTLNGEEEIGLPLNGTVIIDWRVISADSSTESIKIYQKDLDGRIWGELESHYGGNEVTGTFTVTFNEHTDKDMKFMIQAKNRCCTLPISKKSTVHLREPTEVTVYAIEVNQSIQNFNMNKPELNNCIPLVEGKQTVVRVYAGSGKDSDLDHVTGQLHITQYIDEEIQNTVPYISTSYPVTDKLPPDNRVDSTRPRLKFPLWVQIAKGDLELKVELYSTDEWAAWEPVEFTTTISFEEASPLDIYLFRVKINGYETSDEEVRVFLEKLHAIFPVSFNDGINVVGEEILDISDEDLDLNEDEDFHDEAIWGLGRFWHKDFFDVFDTHLENGNYDDEVIHCAIIPKGARADEKGVGWPGPPDNLGGTPVPMAYWKAKPKGNSYIEAHEIGHAMTLLDQESGTTHIRGVDTRFIGSNSDQFIKSTSTDQMMKKKSDKRWINTPEYLWVYFSLNINESTHERFLRVGEFCAENELMGNFDLHDPQL